MHCDQEHRHHDPGFSTLIALLDIPVPQFGKIPRNEIQPACNAFKAGFTVYIVFVKHCYREIVMKVMSDIVPHEEMQVYSSRSASWLKLLAAASTSAGWNNGDEMTIMAGQCDVRW